MNTKLMKMKKWPLRVTLFWISATLACGEPLTFFGFPASEVPLHLQPTHVHSRPTRDLSPRAATAVTATICSQDPCTTFPLKCSDNPDGSSRCGCKSCFERPDEDVCKDATFDSRNGYVTAYNRVLPFNQTHDVSTVDSICECKASCDARVSCNTASVEPSTTAGKFRCTTTGDLLQNYELKPSKGSYTFAKESSFDLYFSKETGIVYFIVDRVNVPNLDIKKTCETLPNGQMITLSTKQDVLDYRAFVLSYDPTFKGKDPDAWFNVDLTFNAAIGGLVWGDGTPLTAAYNGLLEVQTTPFSASDLGYVIRYKKDSIIVEARDCSWTVCQIKPFQ